MGIWPTYRKSSLELKAVTTDDRSPALGTVDI